MTTRDGAWRSGRLTRSFTARVWTPSLTDTDPEIPFLPLETAAAPPEPPSGTPLRTMMGVGT